MRCWVVIQGVVSDREWVKVGVGVLVWCGGGERGLVERRGDQGSTKKIQVLEKHTFQND